MVNGKCLTSCPFKCKQMLPLWAPGLGFLQYWPGGGSVVGSEKGEMGLGEWVLAI